MVTTLFSLWGFVNVMTNPLMVSYGETVDIPVPALFFVRTIFCVGYSLISFTAALFIRCFSFKDSTLVGFLLYAVGTVVFIQATDTVSLPLFCTSFCVLMSGTAFLKTTMNPFIMSLGPAETATRRLNFAYAFNSVGLAAGVVVAADMVMTYLPGKASAVISIFGFSGMSEGAVIRTGSLEMMNDTCSAVSVMVLIILAVLAITLKKEKSSETHAPHSGTKESFRHLWQNKTYREGVFTQMFSVAAQLMCWTFIIRYAELSGRYDDAHLWFIGAMVLFLCGRFIGAFLMKHFRPRDLIMPAAAGAMISSMGVVVMEGTDSLCSLMAVFFFMSILSPTIFGTALEEVRDYTLPGTALLSISITGGAVIPPLQEAIIYLDGTAPGILDPISATNFSFIVPTVCFLMVAIYGLKTLKTTGK